MKRKEILRLEQALLNVGNLSGVKFAYAVSKNMRTVKNECEDIRRSIESSEDWKRIERKQQEINLEFCKKDENDNPVPTKRGEFIIIPEFKQEHKAKMETLKKENQELFAEREKQIEDYNKSLEEQVEIKLHKISEKDIPENIKVNQLEGIMEMIE